MHACVCSWTHSHHNIHVEVRGQPYFGSHLEQKVPVVTAALDRLTAPGVIPHPICALWDYRHAHYRKLRNMPLRLTFTGIWGPELRSSGLCSKLSHPLSSHLGHALCRTNVVFHLCHTVVTPLRHIPALVISCLFPESPNCSPHRLPSLPSRSCCDSQLVQIFRVHSDNR